MKYRQIHLDFHTSELIQNIGAKFSKSQFQEALKLGHVNAINVFAKCHHGYSYYPSKVNEMHPNLCFDLLGEMIEAGKEVGVETPIYVSVGLDEKAARKHPEWLIRNQDESTRWTKDFFNPGFHELCLNTPYLNELLTQLKELLIDYKPSGVWLDIVGVRACYCQTCVAEAKKMGLDIMNKKEMEVLWEKTYKNYQTQVAKLVKGIDPSVHIFHNSGHFARGRSDLWTANSHYELESLPTGGWSYDHFPLSARYIQGFGKDFLGMTGKFHTSWGEFGGFKHPNALRYEMALNLMNGAKCCVGDQLHPNGEMELATYQLIGEAYKEVEVKEPWCDKVESVVDVAIFSAEVIEGTKMMTEFNNLSDSGTARILLEGKVLFDVIDDTANFSLYKVIIMPDKVRLNNGLGDKFKQYLKEGGKVLASGESALYDHEDNFALDLGISYEGKNTYSPTYFRPHYEPKSIRKSSFVMYGQSHLVKTVKGESLGDLENPYYNREAKSFCSHKHFPTSHIKEADAIVRSVNGIYIAWDIFSDYAITGSIVTKEIVLHALNLLLEGQKTIVTDFGAQGMTTLMHQKEASRFVNHFLYASPVKRGVDINIIEDIMPVYDVNVELRLPVNVTNIYLAPQNEKLKYKVEGDKIIYKVPKITCHQMVVIDYE